MSDAKSGAGGEADPGFRFHLRAPRYGGLEPSEARTASVGGSLNAGYARHACSLRRVREPVKKQSRSRGAFLFASEFCRSDCHKPPKQRGEAERRTAHPSNVRAAHEGVAACLRGRGARRHRARTPSGAPPRLSPKTSRPWLGPVPRFMEAPTGVTVRSPGSELLADRRRGRPGGFPNRPNAVCETARGHRARSALKIASGKRPSASERRGFYSAPKRCQAPSPMVRQRSDSAALFAPSCASAAAARRANGCESTNHRASKCRVGKGAQRRAHVSVNANCKSAVGTLRFAHPTLAATVVRRQFTKLYPQRS